MNKRVAEKDKAGMAVKILIAFITGIYPLLLFEFDMGSVYIQSFILFLSVMGVLLYSFLLIRSNQWELQMPRSRLEIGILILAAYSILRIIGKMITATGVEAVYYDFEITVLALAVIYFLIAARPGFQEWYFDGLLFSGLIVFALLLVKYLCGGGMDGALAILLQDNSGIASYTILVCMTGLWQYLRCEDKLRSIFYIGVLAMGFFVLFINQNRVSIWLMVMVFIAIPVLQRPTAELVKRDMQIFFLYLFMLCNMSLLAGYTKLLQVEVSYNLEQSVYLELLIAIGGIFFFRFWDRIPEGVDLKRLVMRKMRRAYQFLLKLISFIFVGILLGGERWKELPEKAGLKAVKGFAVPLVEEARQGESAFYRCFEEVGLLGGMMILILCVLLAGKQRKAFGFDRPVTGMLVLISSLFLIQLFFWNVSINSLPVYWIFLVIAISYKEEKVKVTSNKISFKGGE